MEDDLTTIEEEVVEPELDEEIPEEEELDEDLVSEEEDDSEDVEDTDDPEDDDEPPVRKSVKDYIIKRKDSQINKKDEIINQYKEKYGDLDSDADLEIDDPELKKVIDKSLKPFRDRITQETDERELQEVLNKYPDAKKLENKIRKYMDAPAYKDVSIDFITRALLNNAGPDKKSLAKTKAKKSKTPGRTKARPKSSKTKSAWDMTDEEFRKESQKHRL